ncbi:MAG: GLPGLI family protein [Bacteroidales bacterium]|nr:GLPGLI family protein [Bacteroidales bacterium]
MKQLLSVLIVCLASFLGASAQQKADILVSFDYLSPNLKTGERSNCEQYLLLANASCSKFYSAQTEYIDSLQSTPEGVAKLNDMRMAAFTGGKLGEAPVAKATIYVTKNHSDGTMAVYDQVGLEKLCYDEPAGSIKWEIADSVKEILGYVCQLATADYHGRKWLAWFAPEIPLQEGPWKLSGLPGLILEACTEYDLYNFTATGLQQTGKAIGPVYLSEDYEKVSRDGFWKAKRKFTDNPIGNVNAQLAMSGMSIKPANGSSGKSNKSMNLPREELDFIETDY